MILPLGEMTKERETEQGRTKERGAFANSLELPLPRRIKQWKYLTLEGRKPVASLIPYNALNSLLVNWSNGSFISASLKQKLNGQLPFLNKKRQKEREGD